MHDFEWKFIRNELDAEILPVFVNFNYPVKLNKEYALIILSS